MSEPDVLEGPGWDVRIVCTVCGQRSRLHRADLVQRGDMASEGDRLPATTVDACYQCTANAGYPARDVRRRHFVDVQQEGEG